MIGAAASTGSRLPPTSTICSRPAPTSAAAAFTGAVRRQASGTLISRPISTLPPVAPAVTTAVVNRKNSAASTAATADGWTRIHAAHRSSCGWSMLPTLGTGPAGVVVPQGERRVHPWHDTAGKPTARSRPAPTSTAMTPSRTPGSAQRDSDTLGADLEAHVGQVGRVRVRVQLVVRVGVADGQGGATGRAGRGQPGGGNLDGQAAGRVGAQPPGTEEERVGGRLAVLDVVEGHHLARRGQ